MGRVGPHRRRLTIGRPKCITATKNLKLPEGVARQVLDWISIRPDRPLITQVSRFDPWKDPLGVTAAYRLVRREVPNVHLALVSSMALDDPEGWDVYQQVRAASDGDPAIHVFTSLTGVGTIEVKAFHRLSDVVVQKSTREGFGLVVSEASWEGTPVVAGRVGGIPPQMADGAAGTGGILVDTVEDTAAAVIWLLQHPNEAAEIAALGRARVREHFLLPRLLLNELGLIADLVRQRPLKRHPLPAGIQAADQRAQVRIVHVLDHRRIGEEVMELVRMPELIKKGMRALDTAAAAAADNGIEAETALLETNGSPVWWVIVEEAGQWGAEPIVMGTHGRRGLPNLLLGSVAVGVVRRADVPVMLVRGSRASGRPT